MTRADLATIRRRASAELSRFARAAALDIARLRAEGPWMTAEELVRMRRRGTAEHARLLAALDQYDAAVRDAPRCWLLPGEGAR